MPNSKNPVPVADLHTPDELLAAAEFLLSSGDPQVRRAVVLEAIIALSRKFLGIIHKTLKYDWMFEDVLSSF